MQSIPTPHELSHDRAAGRRLIAGRWLEAALRLAVVCSVAIHAPSVARAQAIATWNVTSGTWSTAGSWQAGTVPLTTDTASFSGPAVGSSNATVLLDGSVSIAGLSFNSSGTTTLRSDTTTARSLTIGTGGISMASGVRAVTIGVSGSMVDIVLGGSQTWTNLSTGTLTVAGGISDGGSGYSLTKAGAGTLTLSGSSSFSGGVKLQSGTLRMTGTYAAGTGAISAEGGSLFISIANNAVVSNNITLNQNDLTVELGQNPSLSGTITVPAARTIRFTTSGRLGLTNATVSTISGTLVFDQPSAGSSNTFLNLGNTSTAQLTNATVVLENFGSMGIGAGSNATNVVRIGQLISSSPNARLGGTASAAGGTFVIGDKGGDSSFAGTITDNNVTVAGRLTGITKVGNGVFTVSGSNTYQYATTGSGGVLKFASQFALPGGLGSSITGTASNLVIAGGVIGLAYDDMLRPLGTGSNAVQWSGTGGGFAAYGAARTVNFGGSGATVTWGSGNFVPTGAALVLSHTTADDTITFANGIDLGSSNRTIDVARGSVNGVDAVVSGSIAGAGSLTKIGAGTLRLSGTNTYSGTTTAGAGVLRFDSLASSTNAQALGSGSVVNLGVAATSAGELEYNGAGGTLDKNVFALGTGRNRIRNSGGGTLTLSGTLTKDGTILELAGGTFAVTGQITGASQNSDLYVNGASVTLSNTNNNYDGPTYVYGGGTLTLGASNVIPSNSPLILGGTGSDTGTGTIATGMFTDTVASLTTSSLGGTVSITGSGATLGSLTTTGNLTFGAGTDTLALSLTNPTFVRSTLITYQGTRSGTFDTVTGNGNYNVVYGGASSSTIDLQLKADQATSFTLNPASGRVLVGGSTTLSGTLANSSPTGAASLAWNPTMTGSLSNVSSSLGSTIASGSSSTITATFLAGSTAGSQNWSILNTDNNAITTTSTATGSISVVNQRTFTTSTSTIALGFVHQGGSFGSPTVVVTSTGLYATTASGTLGGFTGGPAGLSLGLTSGSLAFNGGSSPESATFTLSGSTSTPGSLVGTFTSQVSAELGSISDVTVAVTGQVYSGQSTWATNGSGNWGTFSGTGADAFGANWGTNQGSPGLDPSFASSDTATFGSALTSGTATISLAGANPSLAGVTFSNAAGSYVLSGGTLALNGGVSPATVSVTAGSHAINSAVSLVTAATVDVAGSSLLSIGGVIAGSGALTKTGSGTLSLISAQTFTGDTTVEAGMLKLQAGASLASSLVTVAAGASLDATDAGGLSLTSGQTLAGEGTLIGGFTIGSGATLAPGLPGMHPGTLFATGTATWAGGGSYNWQINTVAGGVGTSTGWSFLDSTGPLVITSSTASPFTFDLTSFSGIDPAVGGSVADFDPNANYSFLLAEFDGGISGFSAGAFAVNWGGFSPVNGTFSVQQGDTVTGGNANQLYVVYAAVPEPGAFALAAAGLGAWGLGRWRRRRRAPGSMAMLLL